MGVCLPVQGDFFAVAADSLSTSKSTQKGMVTYSVQRAPTDPYFYADIFIKNMVIGSKYQVVQNSNPTSVLASGTCTITDFTITSIPAYANPMFMRIRVRKSSADPKYEDLQTYGYLVAEGVTVYISQSLDPFA